MASRRERRVAPVPARGDRASGPPAGPPLRPGGRAAGSGRGAGAAVGTASGDKLLGGPQAGLILGQADLVTQLSRHPLARALRVDKLTLAALEATLAGPPSPVACALGADEVSLTGRAQRLALALAAAGVDARAVPSSAAVGGGGAPGVALPSAAVSLPTSLTVPLRSGEAVRNGTAPAVVGRTESGRLLLDLRSVPPSDDGTLAAAVIAAAAAQPGGVRPAAAG